MKMKKEQLTPDEEGRRLFQQMRTNYARFEALSPEKQREVERRMNEPAPIRPSWLRRTWRRFGAWVSLGMLALTTSCGGAQIPTPGGWIGVDPTLHVSPLLEIASPSFADALEQAADEYCQRGERCITVVRNSQGRHQASTTKQPANEAWPSSRGCSSKTAIACVGTDGAHRRMWLVTSRASDMSKGSRAINTARHELGHFLGYKHPCEETRKKADAVGLRLCDARDAKDIMHPRSAIPRELTVWPK